VSANDTAAKQAQAVRRFQREKNRKIEALIQLFLQNPDLPIEAMIREFSTVLDATDGRIYLE